MTAMLRLALSFAARRPITKLSAMKVRADLMELGIKDKLAIGNGIQTVENSDQAWARCKMSEKDKGGGAAKAAIALMDLRDSWS